MWTFNNGTEVPLFKEFTVKKAFFPVFVVMFMALAFSGTTFAQIPKGDVYVNKDARAYAKEKFDIRLTDVPAVDGIACENDTSGNFFSVEKFTVNCLDKDLPTKIMIGSTQTPFGEALRKIGSNQLAARGSANTGNVNCVEDRTTYSSVIFAETAAHCTMTLQDGKKLFFVTVFTRPFSIWQRGGFHFITVMDVVDSSSIDELKTKMLTLVK